MTLLHHYNVNLVLAGDFMAIGLAKEDMLRF